MAPDQVWQVEPGNWHVARDKDDTWRVFQEGDPAAESRHTSRDDALAAARSLATGDDVRIKVHNPDGTLDRVIHPRRV